MPMNTQHDNDRSSHIEFPDNRLSHSSPVTLAFSSSLDLPSPKKITPPSQTIPKNLTQNAQKPHSLGKIWLSEPDSAPKTSNAD